MEINLAMRDIRLCKSASLLAKETFIHNQRGIYYIKFCMGGVHILKEKGGAFVTLSWPVGVLADRMPASSGSSFCSGHFMVCSVFNTELKLLRP